MRGKAAGTKHRALLDADRGERYGMLRVFDHWKDCWRKGE
ncbi:unnamed protein product, partial [marine sediment metagenome]